MPKQYACLAEITVGAGGASSIDFSSIPSTYTDLVVKLSGRASGSTYSEDIFLSLNGSTSLTWKALYYYAAGSVGTNASSGAGNGQIAGSIPGATTPTSTFGNAELYLSEYTSSNYKSVSVDSVGENNAAENILGIHTKAWSSTAAITQVTLTPRSGTFVQYTTASLYGITKS